MLLLLLLQVHYCCHFSGSGGAHNSESAGSGLWPGERCSYTHRGCSQHGRCHLHQSLRSVSWAGLLCRFVERGAGWWEGQGLFVEGWTGGRFKEGETDRKFVEEWLGRMGGAGGGFVMN